MEASMLQNVPLKPRNYNYSDHNHKPLTNYFDIVDSASLYARVKSFPGVYYGVPKRTIILVGNIYALFEIFKTC